MEGKMNLKINVLTPTGQAVICMEKHKKTLLGHKKANTIKEQGLISDKEFYWIMPVKDNKEMLYYRKRLTIGEDLIKTFYRQLYKYIKLTNRTIKIGNKIGKAGKKGVQWIANRMNKVLMKSIPDPANRKEMIDNLKIDGIKIDKGLFKEIKIDDRKEMDELLSGELIKTTILN